MFESLPALVFSVNARVRPVRVLPILDVMPDDGVPNPPRIECSPLRSSRRKSTRDPRLLEAFEMEFQGFRS